MILISKPTISSEPAVMAYQEFHEKVYHLTARPYNIMQTEVSRKDRQEQYNGRVFVYTFSIALPTLLINGLAIGLLSIAGISIGSALAGTTLMGSSILIAAAIKQHLTRHFATVKEKIKRPTFNEVRQQITQLPIEAAMILREHGEAIQTLKEDSEEETLKNLQLLENTVLRINEELQPTLETINELERNAIAKGAQKREEKRQDFLATYRKEALEQEGIYF
ncbi:MAG: hypothetical protein Q8L98_06455 [Chlamydiales bacterium]|nr:hypothetical protein [Chlamydiales bacterium]